MVLPDGASWFGFIVVDKMRKRRDIEFHYLNPFASGQAESKPAVIHMP